MVQLQLLNKILRDGTDDVLENNGIDKDYFTEYPDEFEYIQKHKNDFGNIPDMETFLSVFDEFECIQVNEGYKYLVDTIREEHLYQMAVPIIQNLAEKMQTNSYEAVDELHKALETLKIPSTQKGIDIIANARDRYEEYERTKENPNEFFIPTGFEELDEIIGGFHKGEELAVLFARTGEGKSWVLLKMLEHIWKVTGLNIGLIEPEMGANKTGYRFDTVHKHFSNTSLSRGKEIDGYEQYINHLSKSKNSFWVAHTKDFDRNTTVGKLRSWCVSNNIGVLAIDGISYLKDQRGRRGDNKTTALTNISEDLMELSIELKIPIIVVVQANREGTMMEDLQLEHIRDSDGIAYNASVVLSIQQKEEGTQLNINKSRNSSKNHKLMYIWHPDIGTYDYIPLPKEDDKESQEKAEDLRRQFADELEEEY